MIDKDRVFLNDVLLEAICIWPLNIMPECVSSAIKGFLTAKFKLQLIQADSEIQKETIKDLYFEIYGELLK